MMDSWPSHKRTCWAEGSGSCAAFETSRDTSVRTTGHSTTEDAPSCRCTRAHAINADCACSRSGLPAYKALPRARNAARYGARDRGVRWVARPAAVCASTLMAATRVQGLSAPLSTFFTNVSTMLTPTSPPPLPPSPSLPGSPFSAAVERRHTSGCR